MKTSIDLLYLRPGEISKEEVAAIVGEKKMTALKAEYEHPDLRCFVIAHEGTAEGKLVDDSRTVILSYLKRTIRELYRAIQTGLPAFFRHTGGNNVDRLPIGEVVGKQLKEDANGDMYTLAVFLIYPEYKDLTLDIASVESNLVIDRDQYGNPEIVSVEEVSAVALSTSALEEPGFPNARLLAAFSYFADKKDHKMDLTLEQVKNWLSENAARPSDIFSVVEICRDAEVDKEINQRLQTKHEHARRLETKLADIEKERADEKSDLQKQIEDYQRRLIDATAAGMITTSLAEVEDAKMRGIVEKKLQAALPKALEGITDPDRVREAIKAQQAAVLAEIEELKTVLAPPPEEKPKPVDRKDRQPAPKPGPDRVVDDNPLVPAHNII